MPYAGSITSYPDIVSALDRAIESPKGIRLLFESEAARMTFTGRAHSFRHLDRRENSKMYAQSDPMYGRSAYDPLMIRKGTIREADGRTIYPVEIVKLEGVEFTSEELE
jgi:hypothetical protein